MPKQFSKSVRPRWTEICVIVLSLAIFAGCATDPLTPLHPSDGSPALMRRMMARNNKIVLLSPETGRTKPALLLLHGATEDPGEMIEIVREWKTTHDVFLYSYDYHQNAKKLATALVKEMKRLQIYGDISTNLTVVAYSYSAIIFRTAVILAGGEAVFSDASLIQLAPTSGGSRLARGLSNPLAARIVDLVSKPTAASNPNFKFARQLWGGEGNQKFYDVIKPNRMWSILVQRDTHSLAGVKDEKIQSQYQNGLGPNVIKIPEWSVSHEYMPTDPLALAYLRNVLLREDSNLARSNNLPTAPDPQDRLSRLP